MNLVDAIICCAELEGVKHPQGGAAIAAPYDVLRRQSWSYRRREAISFASCKLPRGDPRHRPAAESDGAEEVGGELERETARTGEHELSLPGGKGWKGKGIGE